MSAGCDARNACPGRTSPNFVPHVSPGCFPYPDLAAPAETLLPVSVAVGGAGPCLLAVLLSDGDPL